MQGKVKQVYSGDRIVLYGPVGKQGVPLEKVL
jgi:tRNA(Ile2) C34 agmatinyltransferase TiaS